MIGKGSVFAGQAGVVGHITIGEGSVVASQSGVTKSIPPGSVVIGFPAKPETQYKHVNACLQRLPHYVDLIKSMEKRVVELEQRSTSKSSVKKKITRRKK